MFDKIFIQEGKLLVDFNFDSELNIRVNRVGLGEEDVCLFLGNHGEYIIYISFPNFLRCKFYQTK